MATNSGKDTIYIDADEEITGIIDKVRSSDKQLVALVLPKRAAMLQSSVNMKLLKKSADNAKKHLVLVTTESGLMPLASAVGVYVARSLDSKPEIPSSLSDDSPLDELAAFEETATEADFDPSDVANKPVGELANMPEESEEAPKKNAPKKVKPELSPRPIPFAASDDDDDEPIELDNTIPEKDLAETAAVTADIEKDKKAKNKKLRVPNFERFRLRLFLGAALLILIIGGFIIANIVLPAATIAISTKTSNVAADMTLELSTSATQVNVSNATLPASLQQTKKSQSQQVSTTGQKNVGTPATGTAAMTAQVCNSLNPPADVPAGTGLTSNGLTFITQQNTSFSFSQISGGCIVYQSSTATPITAQSGGSQYNMNSANFSVAGRSDVTASGSTSGGTDKIVQVVSATDIQNAQNKIGSIDTGSVKSSLQSSLQQGGYYPLPDTFNAGSPSTSSSAQVGDQANTVTVTETINYTMFGVKKSDLQTLIKNNVDGQIDTSKQAIVDYGLSGATFNVASQNSNSAQINMQDNASVGPNIDIASLKKQIEGKKSGDVQNIIQNIPGVTSVNVHFSPFWVSSVPNKTNKITIHIKKANG